MQPGHRLHRLRLQTPHKMMMLYQDRSRAHRETLHHYPVSDEAVLFILFCTVMLTQTAGEAESRISMWRWPGCSVRASPEIKLMGGLNMHRLNRA